MRRLLILRPEPGNCATAMRARALGLDPLQCPLFVVEAVTWTAPDPDQFDYLLLTSANAVRMAGRQLSRLGKLPTVAVGPATAHAARHAGLPLAHVGDGGVEASLASIPDTKRLLHLTGADHIRPPSRYRLDTRIVYRAMPLTPRLPVGRLVALVHSARAGQRLAQVAQDPGAIAIAAISTTAAEACGAGWETIAVAESPDEATLLALAVRLCQD